MSRRERINHWVGQGTLFPLPPLIKSALSVRHIIVSQEVFGAVNMPWPGYYTGELHADLRATLDAFTTNEIISVSENPFDKPSYTDLARVHPIKDEIWEFRSTDRPPGMRAFGCFSEWNVFVALTWEYRENLDGAWTEEITRFKDEWRKLFDAIPPFHGASLDDYLSNYRAV